MKVAQADQWPTRPITMVVPFAAGGPTDVVGRILADRLSDALGQQVIVENIGGAGGMNGAQRVAVATPDGYQVLSAATRSLERDYERLWLRSLRSRKARSEIIQQRHVTARQSPQPTPNLLGRRVYRSGPFASCNREVTVPFAFCGENRINRALFCSPSI
jgi:Tripartite tricarboxylate transporter family receptor